MKPAKVSELKLAAADLVFLTLAQCSQLAGTMRSCDVGACLAFKSLSTVVAVLSSTSMITLVASIRAECDDVEELGLLSVRDLVRAVASLGQVSLEGKHPVPRVSEEGWVAVEGCPQRRVHKRRFILWRHDCVALPACAVAFGC